MGRKAFLLAILTSTLFSATAAAEAISYSDFGGTNAVTLGSMTIQCPGTTICVSVSITFVGSTSTVVPFSVPGASGFENFTGAGSLTIYHDTDVFTANFLPGEIYVSVDLTNGGAGFGSKFGPTYPLATYRNASDFAGYDLKSNFGIFGYGPFCPDVSICDGTPPALKTAAGDFSISGAVRPAFAGFSSTILPTPEPASIGLCGAAAALLALAGAKRRNP